MEPQSSTAFEVAGEPGVYWCARHKNVKTRLRCGRCETPICPKCTIMGPTGARCRDCASNRTSHMYQVKPLHFLSAFAASLVLGVLGAFVLKAVGIFILFFASAVGPLLGKVVTTITRGKRGSALAAVVSGGLVIGALATAVLPALTMLSALPPGQAAGAVWLASGLLDPYLWIFLALAIPGVWWWLK